MGDMEWGKCPICGEEGQLFRTYFYYDVKCSCHSPHHFELRHHCKNCKPKEPQYTKIEFRTSDLKRINE
jgi:hypothetical protein